MRSGRFGFALLAGFLAPGPQQPAAPVHPLDQLSAPEIELAREVLAQAGLLRREMRFAYLGLREPPKSAVQQQTRSGVFRRNAEALLFDWATSTPFRAHIDLGRRKLIRWDTLPSREPPMRALIRRRLEVAGRGDFPRSGSHQRHRPPLCRLSSCRLPAARLQEPGGSRAAIRPGTGSARDAHPEPRESPDSW